MQPSLINQLFYIAYKKEKRLSLNKRKPNKIYYNAALFSWVMQYVHLKRKAKH